MLAWGCEGLAVESINRWQEVGSIVLPTNFYWSTAALQKWCPLKRHRVFFFVLIIVTEFCRALHTRGRASRLKRALCSFHLLAAPDHSLRSVPYICKTAQNTQAHINRGVHMCSRSHTYTLREPPHCRAISSNNTPQGFYQMFHLFFFPSSLSDRKQQMDGEQGEEWREVEENQRFSFSCFLSFSKWKCFMMPYADL